MDGYIDGRERQKKGIFESLTRDGTQAGRQAVGKEARARNIWFVQFTGSSGNGVSPLLSLLAGAQ